MTRTGPFSPRGRFGDPFAVMRQELNRVAEEFGRFAAAGPTTAAGGAGLALARVDMSETEDGLDIEVEAPGVEARGLDLDVRGDVLTIRAVREMRRDVHERSWHVRERAMSGVSRTLTLPFTPEPDLISARLEHGVLHVHVPKSREGATRRVKIPIGGEAAAREGGRDGGAQAAPKGPADPSI